MDEEQILPTHVAICNDLTNFLGAIGSGNINNGALPEIVCSQQGRLHVSCTRTGFGRSPRAACSDIHCYLVLVSLFL